MTAKKGHIVDIEPWNGPCPAPKFKTRTTRILEDFEHYIANYTLPEVALTGSETRGLNSRLFCRTRTIRISAWVYRTCLKMRHDLVRGPNQEIKCSSCGQVLLEYKPLRALVIRRPELPVVHTMPDDSQ